MGLIFCTAGQKGGVGKTTTVVHLGIALASLNTSVLCIDTDPQGGLIRAFRPDHDLEGKTTSEYGIYDVFSGNAEISEITTSSCWPTLHLVEPGFKDHCFTSPYPEDVRQISGLLREAMQGIRKHYEIILIDCPPGMNAVVTGSLAVADFVLLPVQCEPPALRTLPVFLRYLFHLREERQIQADIAGILLTMMGEGDDITQLVASDVAGFVPADLLFPVAIPRDPLINRLMLQPDQLRQNYEQWQSQSPAILAYRQLADHFIRNYPL